MHQLAGRHLQARCPGACLRDAGVSQWCGPAALQRCHARFRRQQSPHKLHVSCPAVEQDTEVASTSGRPHSDSELIQSLLAQEQAAVVDLLAQQPEQPNIQKELIKRIQLSGSLSLLCELVQAESHHFDHKVTSVALHRLSILCHAYFTQLQSAHLTSQDAQQAAWVKTVDPALKTLGQLLLQHMDSCDAFTVAISLWAYGHMQCGEEAVLAALSIRGMQLLQDFNTIDCASALVGMAKHSGPRTRSQREFVEQLMQHTHALLSHVDEWAPRDVISIVWALSQLGAAGPSRRPLLQGLVEMALWRLDEFGVKELVITVYSLGRLRMRLPLQMVKLTNRIMARLHEMKPQDAANLVYACAKVQFKQPELLQKLPSVMVPQLSSFKPQEIGNLLYGYGQLHYPHPELLDAVARACGPRLHEFTTQDLCMTVWAYGAVNHCPPDTCLFEAACRVLLQRKDRLVPLQITCVVKGFSRAGYQPPASFMAQMSQLAQVKLSQFSPLEYSQLLWAYSAAGYRDVQLFEAVVAHAIQQLYSKDSGVTKTTVDTMLVACQGVGFWPQLLVDTAEINGLYVRTKQQLGGEEVQPLVRPVLAAATDAAHAAAQAVTTAQQQQQQQVPAWGTVTAAEAEAALAAAAGANHAAVAAGAVPGVWDEQAAAAAAAAAGEGAVRSDDSSAAVAQAIADAFGVTVEGPAIEVPTQQLQQLLQKQQQKEQPSQHRQPSRLDGYGLQRPQLPQRRQQQQQGLPQQSQQPQQQLQQPKQQGVDHPLLRSQLVPPPALPKQQQRHSTLPAAAIDSMLHSNGTSSSHSQHSNEHSSQQDSSNNGALQQQQQQQQPDGDTLVHPVEQL